jgi:hypothetical protein
MRQTEISRHVEHSLHTSNPHKGKRTRAGQHETTRTFEPWRLRRPDDIDNLYATDDPTEAQGLAIDAHTLAPLDFIHRRCVRHQRRMHENWTAMIGCPAPILNALDPSNNQPRPWLTDTKSLHRRSCPLLPQRGQLFPNPRNPPNIKAIDLKQRQHGVTAAPLSPRK